MFESYQIKYGGFFLYLLGKTIKKLKTIGIMYAFLGISLVTQNYINPSIDIIKRKGVVSVFVFKLLVLL